MIAQLDKGADMSQPMDTVYCQALRSMLLLNRTLFDALIKNTEELAALRATVSALDPTFEENYRQNLKDKSFGQEAAHAIEDMRHQIDHMIESLKELQAQFPT